MDDALKVKNREIKGGLLCLLSYFVLAYSAYTQTSFVVHSNVTSPNYGAIWSPIMQSEIIEELSLSSFSFEKWSSFFHIKVKDGTRPVLGAYEVRERRIAFTPRFLPDENVSYEVTFSFPQLNKLIQAKTLNNHILQEVISFEMAKSTFTQVLGVSPNTETLPANLLRIYIHFSSPMGLKNPYEHLMLLDETGNKIEDSFVEIPQGLWNEDRTRLTLLFHPGRVKRGVGPNMKQGAILEEGKTYQLKISKDWRDMNGNPLAGVFTKQFKVTEAVRSKMDIEDWDINATSDKDFSLRIVPDRPVDMEMIRNFITIVDSSGSSLTVEIIPTPSNSFIFQSNEFLKETDYTLIINPRLEDVCGNTFLNAFDYKTGRRNTSNEEIKLNFRFE